MATLKDIFAKPVDRPIEGVIKADDDASLRLEFEEYVLTNEIEKRLEQFFDAYTNYDGANGVWVSGFFGSGKSHLLKMLAFLLENREIDGAAALDLFLPKCGENEILRGDVKRAVAIPSKSILFNIDQKADVISKTQIDALLAVFMKVFDEMCGYYGKQGHIAQFERDLDSRSLYDGFKTAYETIAGRTWYIGREQALLESNNIAKAYAQVTEEDEATAKGILDKYRSEYSVSIEDFAAHVNSYIEQQSARTGQSDYRLNFFVDEVGQYIADNVKLMTNLQTIAESLATKCRGKAWVIVTAQEDMGTVVGEMSRQQGTDFSKIQDRFKNRMKLTSADVAEVIQKRLLMKTEDGVSKLTELYHAQVNNFKTLFDFADGAQTYRNFQDRDHFIQSYPFIPYQFTLFQSAIQNLSIHNAFEGKHSSVGERSMLGVFQQVVIHIGEHELGRLSTFDLMFEGIRSSLKSQIQRAISQQAEIHLADEFAVRVLKALFLVKYIKEFNPTVRNLCVLMLDSFEQDLAELKKRVEEALNLLEQQTYIQRNGDVYEYLTDEEKDIEQEIKHTEVEPSDVASELQQIIFDQVIKTRKIRYTDNGQDYPFSRKLDDELHGRENELAIHVLSPFYDRNIDVSAVRMQSMGRDELLIYMPPDDRLVRDLFMYKRTEKYIRQNISITQQDSIRRILDDKGHQNQERLADLRQRISIHLGKAQMFVAGYDVEIGSENPQTRIEKGFHELIARTYPNLSMLRDVQYSETMISSILDSRQGTLEGMDVTSLSEAEQEILSAIQGNNRSGVRTTLKSLLEKFERKPYGWYYAAVLCNVVSLCARGKLEVRVDSNLIDGDALEQVLRNSRGHANVVLEPQIEFTASQVRALKDFYQDFFDRPPHSAEAKALGNETCQNLKEFMHEIREIAVQGKDYPFLVAIQPVIDTLKEVVDKPYTWYLKELNQQADELLDMKEAIVDPLRTFMNGSQKEIYDRAVSFVSNQESNFSYIDDEEVSDLKNLLQDSACYKGSLIQHIKSHQESLQDKIDTQIWNERDMAQERVAGLENRLVGMGEYSSLDGNQKETIRQIFQACKDRIDNTLLIAVIRDTVRQFEENEYQQLLQNIALWSRPAQVVITTSDTGPDTVSESPYEYVSGRSLSISFDQAWLASEDDVDRYVEALRERYLAEIRKGKRIQI